MLIFITWKNVLRQKIWGCCTAPPKCQQFRSVSTHRSDIACDIHCQAPTNISAFQPADGRNGRIIKKMQRTLTIYQLRALLRSHNRTFSLKFHWPEFSHMMITSCKGIWEMCSLFLYPSIAKNWGLFCY